MNHQTIQRFIDRVRQVSRSRGKTIPLPLDEAQDLANDLTLLLLRENELLREIIELKKNQAVTEIVLGGGSFK